MANPIIDAATVALSKQALKHISKRAVKKAAPIIARTAISTATSAVTNRAVRRVTGGKKKVVPSKSKRSTRRFAPVAYTTSFAKSGKTVRIAQSEIVADISPETHKDHWWSLTDSANDYTIFPLEVSPSNATTFPWLSNVAGLFDKFRFHKLNFTFVSTRPTNTKGNVAMGVDFDVYDSIPKNIIDMSNLSKFSTSPVYVNQTLSVPVSHPGAKTWYFCADGTDQGDKKTYNIAKYYLALAGVEDIKSHGYLIVDYDVELCDKNPHCRTVKTVVDKEKATTATILDQDSELSSDSAAHLYYDNDGDRTEEETWFEIGDDGTITLSDLGVGDKVALTIYAYSAQSGISATYKDSIDIPGMAVETVKTLGDNTKCVHMLVGTTTTAGTITYSSGLAQSRPQDVSLYLTATAIPANTLATS